MLVPILAGCLEPDGHVPNPTADLDRIDAPTWSRGHWFQINTTGYGGLPTPSSYKIIVTEATEDGYVTGTSTKAAALTDLVWGDPFIGHLDVSLYDAAETPETGFPKLFDFPLTPNKTWTTRGFGAPFEFTAQLDARTPTAAGLLPGYRIEGAADAGSRIYVTYVPSWGWFGNMSMTNPFDEHQDRTEVVDHGKNYSGEVWLGEVLVKKWSTWNSVQDGSHAVDVPVSPDATDLFVFVGQWSQATSHGSLLDPAGRVHKTFGPTAPAPAASGSNADSITIERPIPGSWRLVLESIGAGGTPAYGGIYYKAVAVKLDPVAMNAPGD